MCRPFSWKTDTCIHYVIKKGNLFQKDRSMEMYTFQKNCKIKKKNKYEFKSYIEKTEEK